VKNGNWQTAQRWARMLRSADYQVTVTDSFTGQAADVMIALHARRSAASVQRWAMERPGHAQAVVLTGTDLYGDIHIDPAAQRSLALADRLVVLHEGAVADLPLAYRPKALVCLQSTPARATLVKTTQHLRALMVGHLRDEKQPRTYFAAARLLAKRADIALDHIGAALDPALGLQASATQAACPGYRWLGTLPHAATRARIQRAHVLVHPSRVEGGAHVVIEAIRSGTPVLASRIAGNVGLLGSDYAGYFEPGDAAGLAALLLQGRDEPTILATLRAQCAARAPLFAPEHERATLITLLHTLLETSP
jgi:putative glycosyltransferase (TIGR04348 family)